MANEEYIYTKGKPFMPPQTNQKKESIFSRYSTFFILAALASIPCTVYFGIHCSSAFYADNEFSILMKYAIIPSLIEIPFLIKIMSENAITPLEYIKPIFLSIIGALAFNYFFCASINNVLDFSDSCKVYNQITNKFISEYTGRSWHSTSYIIGLIDKSIKVTPTVFGKANEGQIIVFETKPGLLGIEHLVNIDNILFMDPSDFPPNTVFPFKEEKK